MLQGHLCPSEIQWSPFRVQRVQTDTLFHGGLCNSLLWIEQTVRCSTAFAYFHLIKASFFCLGTWRKYSWIFKTVSVFSPCPFTSLLSEAHSPDGGDSFSLVIPLVTQQAHFWYTKRGRGVRLEHQAHFCVVVWTRNMGQTTWGLIIYLRATKWPSAKEKIPNVIWSWCMWMFRTKTWFCLHLLIFSRDTVL